MEVQEHPQVFKESWEKITEDIEFTSKLVAEILPNYLSKCRWYAGKSQQIKQFTIDNFLRIETGIGPAHICMKINATSLKTCRNRSFVRFHSMQKQAAW